MSEHTAQPDHQQLPEAELLISRLVDGEASDADRARFDALAAEDSVLPQALVRQQQAMEKLADALDADLSALEHIGLPDPARSLGGASVFRFWPAYLGWAAALVLADREGRKGGGIL